MDTNSIDIDQLVIAPFEKGMTKGVFYNVEEEFTHLVEWYKTQALHSQRDKKSKHM